VTRHFEEWQAKATAKDNLARANRLRSLANETTTPKLRVRLLEAAEECEGLASQKQPEPRVDPTLLKIRRERPWPGQSTADRRTDLDIP
jgi:hypothetical protein